MSKAANRSVMNTAVICLFSLAHRVSLTNLAGLFHSCGIFCKLIGILGVGCVYHSVWLVYLECTSLLFWR